MSLVTYIALSVLIIMVWHFSLSTNPRNFGLMQMIGIFIFAGALGWYMETYEFGLVLALAFSLFFIH